jgi:hypothetical protein
MKRLFLLLIMQIFLCNFVCATPITEDFHLPKTFITQQKRIDFNYALEENNIKLARTVLASFNTDTARVFFIRIPIDGETSLEKAVKNKNLEMVSLLLEPFTFEEPKMNFIMHETIFANSALAIALQQNNTAIAQLLIQSMPETGIMKNKKIKYIQQELQTYCDATTLDGKLIVNQAYQSAKQLLDSLLSPA